MPIGQLKALFSSREQFVYNTFRPFDGQDDGDGYRHWQDFEELWQVHTDTQIHDKKKPLWETLSRFTSEYKLKEGLHNQRRDKIEICSIAISVVCDPRALQGVETHSFDSTSHPNQRMVFVPAGDPMDLLGKVDWSENVKLFAMYCSSVAANAPRHNRMWITSDTNSTEFGRNAPDRCSSLLRKNYDGRAEISVSLVSHSEQWLESMVSDADGYFKADGDPVSSMTLISTNKRIPFKF